jgi:cupin 2 domain-containing protein
MLKSSIFNEVEIQKGQEFFETLHSGRNIKIERIISLDHSTPDSEVYDQSSDEWVMLVTGNAIIRFLEPEVDIELQDGDFVFIPAQKKHRVILTDKEKITIWLAIHIIE